MCYNVFNRGVLYTIGAGFLRAHAVGVVLEGQYDGAVVRHLYLLQLPAGLPGVGPGAVACLFVKVRGVGGLWI